MSEQLDKKQFETLCSHEFLARRRWDCDCDLEPHRVRRRMLSRYSTTRRLLGQGCGSQRYSNLVDTTGPGDTSVVGRHFDRLVIPIPGGLAALLWRIREWWFKGRAA
jgi:hypothetical protein